MLQGRRGVCCGLQGPGDRGYRPHQDGRQGKPGMYKVPYKLIFFPTI